MKFMLGVNYWGRAHGTEMWLHYDGSQIREELKQLARYGVRCMRVFPNWRDFQPVDRAYGWRGMHGEYVHSRTGMPVYDDGVDRDRIEEFRDFCHAAAENGIELVVAIVTGWMSGRLFNPPALNGKNLITDPEALMWMRRYVRRFVRELKSEKAITVWDLGNECNCLGEAATSYEAYNWTAAVTDAIRSEDRTRPISSGMHALEVSDGSWQIGHQAELCDILTPHPYPSPTVGGDKEPYTRLRMTCLPTAQSLFYSGVGQCPAYIQESGTFSQTIGNNHMAADFMRIQILSALANGLCGYQWWCAWEQDHLNFPPYTWAMIERELGLFDRNNEPKPVAYVMQRMAKLLETVPDPFPSRKADGICLLSRGQKHQQIAIASLLLGKQAGIDLDVAYSDTDKLPDAGLYFMPNITGWQVLYKKTWDCLLEQVRNGATLCLSFAGGQITTFPEIVGAESMGFLRGNTHSFPLNGQQISYTSDEILLRPTTAEVICENEAGNPVLLRNRYGKGWVYFINFSPETIVFETSDGFNQYPYHLLYREVAGNVIAAKPVTTEQSDLGITVNPESDTSCLVTVLNYSDKTILPELKFAPEYEIQKILYGDLEKIPACDGVILRLKRG